MSNIKKLSKVTRITETVIDPVKKRYTLLILIIFLLIRTRSRSTQPCKIEEGNGQHRSTKRSKYNLIS